MKYLLCTHCKNLVEVVEDSNVPIICCGQPMKELDPRACDGASEKHVPVVTLNENEVKVAVGSVFHPMSEEHYISWVSIENKKGYQRKMFTRNSEPVLCFTLEKDDELLRVYAYCNLHGLWVTEEFN